MTNANDRTDDTIDGLDANLASDLHELYAAPVPALRFQRTTSAPQDNWLSQLLRRGWRPAAAVAATAAAAAAVLVGPSLWSGQSEVSAETIFARASASAESNAPAAGQQSYHLIAITESPGQLDSTTETWFVDSSHQRTENDWSGDGSPDWGISVNGADAWMYANFDGIFRAVHGPASELGQNFAGQTDVADVSEVLSQYTANCQKAALDGEETIAGRDAYRVVVTPDVEACPTIGGDLGKDIGKLGTLVVVVDKETFLPLKTEQQDDGGLPAYTYTVTEIEVGGDVGDEAFTYTAPDGVIVQEVADVTGAKNALSGYNPDGTPQTP